MRTRIVSIIFCVLAACLIPFAAASNGVSAEAAPAVDIVNCASIRLDPGHVEIRCTAAGLVVLDTTVTLPPGATVTLPPLPPVTVRVPGPTQTQTIRVPVPGPTQTVHVTEAVAGPTKTVTANGPTSTVTATSTATSSTGQVDNGGGTLGPSPSATPAPNDPVISIPSVTTVKGAVLGTIAILILCAIILAALFGGYTLGYKEADVANATFMKRILNK